MNLSDSDKCVIQQYENDEEMMVLIFAQWCVNHRLDPVALYQEAYPEQQANKLLQKTLEKTAPKEESAEISTAAVLHVLQEFGNDDLAFVVQEAANKKTDGI